MPRHYSPLKQFPTTYGGAGDHSTGEKGAKLDKDGRGGFNEHTSYIVVYLPQTLPELVILACS